MAAKLSSGFFYVWPCDAHFQLVSSAQSSPGRSVDVSAQAYLSVAQLRELLLGMEQELGIGDLSQNEKDVLYAVQVAMNPSSGVAKSDDIRNHMLLSQMTQPTFHRSLKSLIKKGFVGHAPQTKAGSYVLATAEEQAA
jgi:DNA-binding MarR family transcriptional regulator